MHTLSLSVENNILTIADYCGLWRFSKDKRKSNYVSIFCHILPLLSLFCAAARTGVWKLKCRRNMSFILSLNSAQYQQWLTSRCVTSGVVTQRDSVTCDMSQLWRGGRWRHWHCWQWACWANQDGINKQLEHVFGVTQLRAPNEPQWRYDVRCPWCLQLTAHSAQLSSRAEIFTSRDLSFCRQNGGSLWGSTYKIV